MSEATNRLENAYARLQAGDLSGLDETSLMLLFHHKNWKRMKVDERLRAMQEVENRRAKADGRPAVSLRVDFGMPANMFGGHCVLPDGEEAIIINPRFLVGGKLFGRSAASTFSAAKALGTVLHEGRHAFQVHAVRDALASIPERQRREWAAVTPSEGGLYTDEDPILYFVQSIEMDARRFARRKVAQVGKLFDSMGLSDPGFELQTIKDVKMETLIISRVRMCLTRDRLDQYEKKVLDHFKKTHPELDLAALRPFDHVRFILDHPEIKDAKEMLERLDKMADERMGLADGKPLNRIRNPQLNGLRA